MLGFFKKNSFQIAIGIIGLVGFAYILNANVGKLMEDNRQLKVDVADLKTFKEVQYRDNLYTKEYLLRISGNVDDLNKKMDRLLRR